MLGIDAEMKERLKCRKGIKNATEEAKWEHMYKILFPEAENIPSPCKSSCIIPYPVIFKY